MSFLDVRSGRATASASGARGSGLARWQRGPAPGAGGQGSAVWCAHKPQCQSRMVAPRFALRFRFAESLYSWTLTYVSSLRLQLYNS